MKRLIVFLGLPILFLFFTLGCKDEVTEPGNGNELIVKPAVTKTLVNYGQETFRAAYPDTASLHKIGEAYKSNYSQEAKNQFIDYVHVQVGSLGENKEMFIKCMDLTGCKETASISLPTNVERAKYNGEDVWIIQLVWGMEPMDLGHYKCFAIGISKLDTLDFIRCK